MSTTILPLSVSYNPWFGFAAILLVRFVIVGMAWSWTLPHDAAGREGRFERWTLTTAWSLLVGLAVSILVAVLLAEAGAYTVAMETTVLALVTAAGCLTGARIRKRAFVNHVLAQIPGAACLGAAMCLLMLLPQRGEWIAGGWDPGIYVNQGVMVSQTATFHPDADPLLSALEPAEFETFTRPAHNYIEYLPVVPVDPESRRIEHFFFRGTPSVAAILFRSGGLRAATRINHVLGCVSLVMMFALMLVHGRRQPWAWSACALLAAHPVWLYMLSFPTSEMLQLVLVCGLGALTAVRRQRAVRTGWIPLLLFLAVVNRFSFFPFAALYLCILTWADLGHPQRRPILIGRAVQAAAAVAGLLYDTAFCAVAVGRLDELIPMLLWPGLILIALALSLEFLCLVPAVRSSLDRPGIRPVGIALAAAGGVALATDRFVPGVQHLNTLGNLLGILPYLGIVTVGAAAVGYALFLFRAEDEDRGYAGFLFFLGSAVVITLSVDAIAGLFPWAVRRHLVYTVPFLALLGAEVVGTLWQMRGGHPVSHSLALLLAGGIVAGTLPNARRAATATEFDGLSALLAEVSSHIDPDAVVVADHFRWGTPLRMIHGRLVLNGEVLWQAKDPDRWLRALAALRRLRDDGRDVLFLTSTEEGIGVYEDLPGTLEAVWTSGNVVVVDMAHHRDLRDFRVRSRHKIFTLSRWSP